MIPIILTPDRYVLLRINISLWKKYGDERVFLSGFDLVKGMCRMRILFGLVSPGCILSAITMKY